LIQIVPQCININAMLIAWVYLGYYKREYFSCLSRKSCMVMQAQFQCSKVQKVLFFTPIYPRYVYLLRIISIYVAWLNIRPYCACHILTCIFLFCRLSVVQHCYYNVNVSLMDIYFCLFVKKVNLLHRYCVCFYFIITLCLAPLHELKHK
jgi:hypothetical protein